MTPEPIPTRATVAPAESITTVVHAFTEAELALADVTSAVAKMRAAAEQLDQATAVAKAETAALVLATDAMMGIRDRLEALGTATGEAAGALRAVDPERLWAHLEAVERQRAEDVAAASAVVRKLVAVALLGTGAGLAAVLLLGLLAAGAIG